MHNFVYLAQRRSQEFSCEPNLGGGVPPVSPGCTSALPVFRQRLTTFLFRQSSPNLVL